MIRHLSLAALLIGSTPAALAIALTETRVEATGRGGGASVSPPERRIREYLTLLRSETPEAMASLYFKESFSPHALAQVGPDDRVEDAQILRHELGSFSIVRIVPSSANAASATLRSGLSGRLREMTIEVEPKPPYKIIKLGSLRTLTNQTNAPRTDVERARMLDDFVSRLAAADYFSGTVLVARDGKVIFSKAYGLAERRFGVPNDTQTRFHLGSITKTFTAVAIAQLVEQGKVSFDDPLSKFVPDFPNTEPARRIRIKHLLTHTSGLTNTPYPPGPRIPTATASVAGTIAAAPRNPMQYEPGTRYVYNNLGFLLLGRIVEIASGQDYYDYIRKHVFEPAGMQSAGTERYDFVRKLSYAYEPVPSWGSPNFVDGRLYIAGRALPFGGSYATTDDILRFSEALRSGVLVGKSIFRLMSTPNPQLGAPRNGYGLSRGTEDWVMGDSRRAVGHGGNIAGVCTDWRQIEDADAHYTYVILGNSGQRACFPIAEYIFDLIPSRG